MTEINRISSLDKNDTQNVTSAKKNSDNAGFSSFLGETKTLDEIFNEASEKYNVPEALIKAIGKAESDFNTKAVSRCGAQGVMQLMPATAKSLGVTDSFDAEQNIMGGAKYISGLLKKYDGDTKLALAAYNAGSGNVAKYGGIPPFEETQNYVKKVVKYMQQGIDTNGVYVSTGSSDSAVSTTKISTAPSAPVQNNIAFLIANTAMRTSSDLECLDSLYSYEDYLKFLDLMLQEEDMKSDEEDKSNYSTKDITYNVPVMNLLKNNELL